MCLYKVLRESLQCDVWGVYEILRVVLGIRTIMDFILNIFRAMDSKYVFEHFRNVRMK